MKKKRIKNRIFYPLGVANPQVCTILHLETKKLKLFTCFWPRGGAVFMPPRPLPTTPQA